MLKEHDVVTATGTIVHAYAHGSSCEVEFSGTLKTVAEVDISVLKKQTEQMTLGKLITALEGMDRDKTITFDFVNFRPVSVQSYRGYYENLAIGYTKEGEIFVKEFLMMLREAMDKTFCGYKGGSYIMNWNTPLWVAESDETGGTAIVDVVDIGWKVVLRTEMVE